CLKPCFIRRRIWTLNITSSPTTGTSTGRGSRRPNRCLRGEKKSTNSLSPGP
ncbi:MAG: hypothetical protein AVDCRST_MAG56-3401, partial [uncultured Cytophagales bacterium]